MQKYIKENRKARNNVGSCRNTTNENGKVGNKVGSCINTTKKAEKLEIKLEVAEIQQQKTKSWK